MTIQIPPQLEAIIRDKVATGRYRDETDVLAEALLALDDVERLEALRAALAEGDAQAERGEYEVWTPALRAEIQREARQMVAEGRQPNPDVLP